MFKAKEPLIHLNQFLVLFFVVLCVSFIPTNQVHATTVTKSVPQLKLSTYRKKLTKGTSYQIQVKHMTIMQRARYKSLNKTIATVSSKGNVLAKRTGTTKISVSITTDGVPTQTLYMTVIVGKNAYSISLISRDFITMEPKQKTYLKTSIKPKDSAETPKFRSTNPSVASVKSSGLIHAKRPGETVIYATLANKKYIRCTIKVAPPSSNKTNEDDDETYEERRND